MRKTMKYLFIAACFTLSIFMISGAVNAAPAISRETYETKQGSITDAEWPITGMYQTKDEVWPPAAGFYERKNPNGLTNAYLNVTVLPNQWPVINLHACEYNGPNNEHGWEALDTNPGVWLGGSLQPAQMGLAVRFVIGAKTIGMYRGNGIREQLPQQQVFMLNSGVKSLKERIVIDFPGENLKDVPDIRGEYVLSHNRKATNDLYSVFALIENLPRSETKTDFFDRNIQIKGYELIEREASKYQNLIGKHGYSFEVWQNGSLIRKFIVHPDLNAVYRFERDGNSVMIYNIDGTKG